MDFVKSLLERTSFKSKWKVQLKLCWDADMCLFFEKGIRGGVSYISMRFRRDNDKYSKLLTQNKNQKSWIFMVIQCLSFFQEMGSIKWTDPKVFDLNKCTINSSKGCVLEVELEYPKELRELLNDYPLVPIEIKIKEKCALFIKQGKLLALSLCG